MFDVRTLNIPVAQQPRANQLIVLPLAKASAGSIIDMEENRELPEKGLVLAAGPGGVGVETGRPIPQGSKVGELVCFGKYAGMKWTVASPKGPLKVFILRDSEVLLSQDAASLELVVHDGDPSKIHEAGLTCEDCPRVTGEDGLDRLRLLANGDDPDAVAPLAEASPLL